MRPHAGDDNHLTRLRRLCRLIDDPGDIRHMGPDEVEKDLGDAGIDPVALVKRVTSAAAKTTSPSEHRPGILSLFPFVKSLMNGPRWAVIFSLIVFAGTFYWMMLMKGREGVAPSQGAFTRTRPLVRRNLAKEGAARRTKDVRPSGSSEADPDEKGVFDFGDQTSDHLTKEAWAALGRKDFEAVQAYCGKTLELYGEDARRMQASLAEYPWESTEKIFSYRALNDVGTCLFIQGEAFRLAGRTQEAGLAYHRVVDEFYYAQAWDPQGWFWKPAEAAQMKLDQMEE